MTAWLRADFLGRPRWVWLLCGALLVGASAWRWQAGVCALFGAVNALRRPRSVTPRDPVAAADPARDALRAHSAAQATDRALAGVARESAQREAQGAQAAATDPADEVAARVAARGRKP